MKKSNELSLEQEFRLANYKKQLIKLTPKQSKKYLIITLKQMMIKDNIIKYFLQDFNTWILFSIKILNNITLLRIILNK